MHTVRNSKYYLAAFFLGSVIALLIATPARSAVPLSAPPVDDGIVCIQARS